MYSLRADLFRAPLVFVDIETNGLNHIKGRVIEVAAIRVENQKIVKSFRTLVNPGSPLPQFITKLTGITDADLVDAPEFRSVAQELRAVIQGAIFVAHNVRFDYSFLKQEFSRVNEHFLPRQLCTLKLSRALFPHERTHKLADLIQRYNLEYSMRHRAYDDAAALWQFVQYLDAHFPVEQIDSAVSMQIKQPALPKNIDAELVRQLPVSPGVYIFENELGQPLYVGKSINIKKRVMSHFGRDYAENKEYKISQAIASVRVEQTAGELSALLLESKLVKELQPLYNRRLRKQKKLLVARRITNKNGYHEVYLEDREAIDPDQSGDILAVYPRRTAARSMLETLVKEYGLCPKLVGLEKTDKACFLFQLHRCKGACISVEPVQLYNERLEEAFQRYRIRDWPYKGPIKVVEQSLVSPEQKILVIDKWCVLMEITDKANGDSTTLRSGLTFDLDTYKILQSYLKLEHDNLMVEPLTKVALKSLQAFA